MCARDRLSELYRSTINIQLAEQDHTRNWLAYKMDVDLAYLSRLLNGHVGMSMRRGDQALAILGHQLVLSIEPIPADEEPTRGDC